MTDEPSPFIERRRRYNRFYQQVLKGATFTGFSGTLSKSEAEKIKTLWSFDTEMKRWNETFVDPPYGTYEDTMPKIKGIKERIHQPLLGTLPSKIFAEDGSYLKGLRLMVLEGPHAGKIGTVESHRTGSSIQLMVDDYGLILARKQEVRPLTEDEIVKDAQREREAPDQKDLPKIVHGFEVGAFVEVHNTNTIWDGTRGKVVASECTSDVLIQVTWSKCNARRGDGTFFPRSWLRLVPRAAAKPEAPAYKIGDRVIGNEKSTHHKGRTGIVKSLEWQGRIDVLFDGQMYTTVGMPLEAISPVGSNIPPGMSSVMVPSAVLLDGLKTRDVHGPAAVQSLPRCRHHDRKIEGFEHVPVSRPSCSEVSAAKEMWVKLEAENRARSEARLQALVRSTHREWPTCPHGKVRAVVDAKTNEGKFTCTCSIRDDESSF